MTYTIEKVATLIGARRYGEHETTVGWLLTDSRSLCFPEQTLFFALRSKRNDGHKFIDELYRRGVRSFVVEQEPADYQTAYPDANFLKVPSPLAALQRLAERHRDEFDIPVVGITGSNGKTWVKEWLHQILMPTMKVTRSPKSYNSQIGVPLSVWLLNEQTQVALFEAGISEPGEMLALHDIIQPTIGVLTSLGSAHQENFRNMDEKCMEKLQLFRDTEVIIYPSDDDTVSRCVRRSQYQGERIGWSRYSEKAPMYVKTEGRKVSYIYKGVEGSYEIPFIDEASIENSITCAIVALYLGMSPEDLAERMAKLEPIAMRLEVKDGQRGLTLINDSYNSDVNSLDIALDFMNRRPDQEGKCKTLILSDIYQSGETPSELYREVSDLLRKRGIDRFVGIGPEIMAQAAQFTVGQKWFFANVDEFLQSSVFRNMHDEIVLLKGARPFGFEHISELLEQKVHETILEVDLNAVVENLNHYRSFMKPETKIVCMIKADAYGAGAVEIAKTLQDHRVDYLAVAVADEGVTLRKAGITQNIIVMNPEMSSFKTLFDYDLEPEVYSFRLMDALIQAARKEGITGWPVHLKLDTGMHRLGFDPRHDIDQLIDRLKHQTAIIPRSVFSHFVGSDSDDFDNFSAHQFELFNEGSKKIQAAFSHKILRHMDNSAGIEHFPERQMDMCRLGIGLYGVDPRTNGILSTVSTLKTTILQLRHVPKEETVGYSRKGKLERDSVIAAIPIGYADGLNRKLGNRHCYCLVNGQKAEYVGNICMDVALIDVTDIPCQEGDSVEIFGKNLPVTVLSDVLETIPYEVLTSVSNRVKRVYYQD
ncbi:bifunctional UDP-N-acetylmuramoyl-tripeptide:D-alanyl-D-alanine ligase/alanine racemase [Prevotella sp. E15-22]|uniref:bifunctional UDP-N-acetylmuramoyl-tripeptide:D-alanyl-D-alanine ligase/alanine racemase n=1 Tax=Prevotella sp. E15-22 TaxID=2937774 RepID=UPI0020556E97|nr:bifunctional UDP-N-acetylmuramoyl-tripeptide:D-alanyl-D-alanine ligase/alanine racemase [Prevotella sp. E15-22]UPS45865.1 bifunctional UDP-N-acetylmuramoyl-tripeptide:D-alanyl-D-alanine ligase/alanine racemase [Prevotella sp. E15-22]